jgi:hypothetical protein
MLDTVAIHPDRDVGGLVANLVGFFDLHHQGIQIHDRIDRLQRAALPGFHFLSDRVGDVGDRLVAQLGAQRALQMGLNIPDCHAARIQRNDHVGQPAESAGALGHQLRLKAAIAVPRGD